MGTFEMDPQGATSTQQVIIDARRAAMPTLDVIEGARRAASMTLGMYQPAGLVQRPRWGQHSGEWIN